MFFHVSTFWCGGFQFIGKIAISKCLPFRLEPDFSLMIYIKNFFSPRIPSIMSLSGIKCTLKKGAGQLFQRWRTRGSSEEHLGGWACPVPTRHPGGLMPGRAARLPCPEEGGLTAELKNSSSVQLLSRVRLFATAWTAAPQVRHQRPSRSWPFGWPFYHECSVNKKTPVPQQTLLCPHPQPRFLQPQRGSHGDSR